MAILNYLNDALTSNLRKSFREMQEYTLNYIKFHLKHLKKTVIKTAMGLFLIAVSAVFLSLAAAYSLIEYLELSISLSFFSIGIILLLIGIIVKINN